MVKERGMVKGRRMVKRDGEGKGLPGPLLLSSRMCPGPVVVGLCHLIIVACGMVMSSFCISIVLSLGHVTSSSLSCVLLCCRCGLSSLVSLCCPCHIIVSCHHPCLATCHPESE